MRKDRKNLIKAILNYVIPSKKVFKLNRKMEALEEQSMLFALSLVGNFKCTTRKEAFSK